MAGHPQRTGRREERKSATWNGVVQLGKRFARMRGMNRRTWLRAAPLSALLPIGLAEALEGAFVRLASGRPDVEEKSGGDLMAEGTKVYELRIYHAAPGRLDDLIARFRDHTDALFAKHGIKSVAYWRALDEPVKSSTFFYILEHPSRQEAAANWKAFQDDPEWKTVKAKSEENGQLVEKIDSTYLMLTDFSKTPGV
jgi:NIPSNAP